MSRSSVSVPYPLYQADNITLACELRPDDRTGKKKIA
jgi:hypothetical protein